MSVDVPSVQNTITEDVYMSIPKTGQKKKPNDRTGIFIFAVSCISTAVLIFIIVEIILESMFATLK